MCPEMPLLSPLALSYKADLILQNIEYVLKSSPFRVPVSGLFVPKTAARDRAATSPSMPFPSDRPVINGTQNAITIAVCTLNILAATFLNLRTNPKLPKTCYSAAMGTDATDYTICSISSPKALLV